MATTDISSPPPDEYVTIEEAMAICKVSRRCIYNWFTRGWLAWVELPSGVRRVKRSDLLKVPTPKELS